MQIARAAHLIGNDSRLPIRISSVAQIAGVHAGCSHRVRARIGVNTAVFSLSHATLFAPPTFARPAEVLQVFSQDKKNPKTFRAFSYPTYRDLREQNTVFSDAMAFNVAMVGIGEIGDTRRSFAAIVSSNYFSVLGVAPVRGRAFLPEEETPGRATSVAIVSYNYWRKHGGDSSIIGSQVIVNSRPFTIVGVTPKGFTGTMQVLAPELWLPLGVYDQVANDYDTANRAALGERAGQHLLIVGRLKPQIAKTAADAALKTLAANLEAAFPVDQKDQTFMTAPLSRFGTSDNPQTNDDSAKLGTLLLGMAAIVLLVACLNLANMLLARGTARRKEIAIRLALGASRVRIVRQLLIEGLVLALIGGALGLLAGNWSSDLLTGSLGGMLPLDMVWISCTSVPMLLATFAFCLLGTVVFALGPALKLSRVAVVADLKQQAAEDAPRRRWRFLPRNPLVVIQIAFSLASLTASSAVHPRRW
jgi:predicted permease